MIGYDRQHVLCNLKVILMRMQAEHGFAKNGVGTGSDDTGRGITVFHWIRECAGLQRCAHSLPFAFRYFAIGDEAFGTPADGAELRRDAGFARTRSGETLGSQFGSAGLDVPKGAGDDDLPLAAPWSGGRYTTSA